MVPQSFYFSGFPLAPANAPMVSQNYTGCRAARPDPSVYAEVAGLAADTLPACQLFDPPSQAGVLGPEAGTPRAPTSADIGRGGGEPRKKDEQRGLTATARGVLPTDCGALFTLPPACGTTGRHPHIRYAAALRL